MEYLKYNKYVMTPLGHWTHQHKKGKSIIRIFNFVYVSSVCIPLAISFYQTRKSFDDILIRLPMIILSIGFYLAFIFFLINTSSMTFITDKILQDYKELEPCVHEFKIIQESGKDGRFMTGAFILLTLFVLTIFCLAPLTPKFLDIVSPLNETRQTVYIVEAEYIFLNRENYYCIVYLHCAFAGWIGSLTVVSYDLMLYTYMQHVRAMFNILCCRLQYIAKVENVNNKKSEGIIKTEKMMYKKASVCALMYNDLLQFIELIDSCFSTYFLINYGCTIILASFQGAMIIFKLHDMALVTRYGLFFLAQFFHILYNCISGQVLLDNNSNFINHLYASDWHVMPPKVSKILLFMMIRSQKEPKVTIGKFSVLSLRTYSMIVKTIFSYLSVLLSLKE